MSPLWRGIENDPLFELDAALFILRVANKTQLLMGECYCITAHDSYISHVLSNGHGVLWMQDAINIPCHAYESNNKSLPSDLKVSPPMEAKPRKASIDLNSLDRCVRTKNIMLCRLKTIVLHK